MENKKAGTKKNIILAKSLELIYRHGVKKVSIRDIAGAAGISQVTIYNHFKNKEALIREIAINFLEQLEKERAEILLCKLSFKKRLEKILLLRKEMIDKRQWGFIMDAINEFPAVKEYVNTVYYPEYKKHLLEFIDSGKQQGYINPDLSDDAILVYIDIYETFYMSGGDVTRNRTASDKLIKDLWTLFWNGLSLNE